jgi:hypothetical protein
MGSKSGQDADSITNIKNIGNNQQVRKRESGMTAVTSEL